jgi:branched-chain amino acid transport system substrate-binding protein
MSKKVWTWLVPLIVVIVIIAILAVTVWKPKTVEKEEEVIKIGAILPLSGPVADLGQYGELGVKIAEEEINSQKGVKIKLFVEDGKNDPTVSLTAAKKLVELDNVDALIVFLTSPVASVAPYAEEKKTVMMAGTTVTSLVEGKNYVFKDYLIAEDAIKNLFNYYFKEQKNKNLALLLQLTDLGKEFEKQIKNFAPRYNVTVSAVEYYTVGSKDYRTQLTKIKASNSDILFIAPFSFEVPILTKQIIELNMSYPVIGGFLVEADRNILQELIKQAGDVITFGYDIDLENPSTLEQKKLIEMLNKKNQTISLASFPYIAHHYDEIKILYNVFSKCNKNKECALKLLKELTYEGAGGKIEYKGNNIGHRSVAIFKFSEEGWKRVA